MKECWINVYWDLSKTKYHYGAPLSKYMSTKVGKTFKEIWLYRIHVRMK